MIEPEASVETEKNGVSDLISLIEFSRDDRMAVVSTVESEQLILNLAEAIASPQKPVALVTPEYSLYSSPKVADPIVFDGNEVVSGQESVVKAISIIKSLATIWKCTIVLGSICEKIVLSSGRPATVNSTVVISEQGIIQKRRKLHSDYFFLDGDSWYSQNERSFPEDSAEMELLGNESFKSFELIDEKGNTTSCAILICIEIASKNLFQQLPEGVECLFVQLSDGSKTDDPDIQFAAYERLTRKNIPEKYVFPKEGLQVFFTNERNGKTKKTIMLKA